MHSATDKDPGETPVVSSHDEDQAVHTSTLAISGADPGPSVLKIPPTSTLNWLQPVSTFRLINVTTPFKLFAYAPGKLTGCHW